MQTLGHRSGMATPASEEHNLVLVLWTERPLLSKNLPVKSHSRFCTGRVCVCTNSVTLILNMLIVGSVSCWVFGQVCG